MRSMNVLSLSDKWRRIALCLRKDDGRRQLLGVFRAAYRARLKLPVLAIHEIKFAAMGAVNDHDRYLTYNFNL
ncbi:MULTISPECIES: hypothetical protein [unclassified Caballeronia]|uniref:hypothetical protein n=1 Tax=unclassified Caballeronia TaxID=2646786 RepID=UPI0028650F72|nr:MULTISPECIES: hypothetical protein [unclassified Caballeronia]MDR5740473.1 hypothetical protein [Caballeronia sp. LZ016]MDR5809006.1 hypothetical protein [Caballeronia sp. LZ019]